MCASETFPDGLAPRVPQNIKRFPCEIPRVPENIKQQFYTRISAIASKSELITKEQEREVLRIWRSILTQYTSKNLTFGTNKLPALAGIVKHIQPLFRNTYLTGIWKDSIILLLRWYCFSRNRRRILPRLGEYRAPT